jgi:HD-GYP domain-containing protein (c-di-GMP phosphodiesterase class II)
MILSDYGHKRIVDLDDIRFLSDVHDVGKIAIPEGILSKKTKLTDSEYEEIKYHCEAGYKIIRNIIDKDEIAYGVLYHHERYDGKGYPHGLKGDNIPLYARILNIADSYDTMIRGRVYQKPISKKEALLDIKNNSGTQFDPNLAANFIRLMEEIND